MSVQVFRDNTVFVNEVFANGRRLFSVFSHALVQVPESIAYITCIAQVTLNTLNTKQSSGKLQITIFNYINTFILSVFQNLAHMLGLFCLLWRLE